MAAQNLKESAVIKKKLLDFGSLKTNQRHEIQT